MKHLPKLVSIVFVLVATLFIFPNVSASYISGKIKIYENGLARFDIETDIPLEIQGLSFANEKLTGTTNSLTKKEGNIWTFELKLKEYDNILLDIELPKNLDSITKISGPESIIDIENKLISIIGSEKLDFDVSYTLKETNDYSWLIWLTILIAAIIITIIIFRIKRKKERLEHIMPIINENEQKIINILMKKPMRQKQLRETLGFPKASFSRYIVNLEKKKLIIREGEGKNKVVKLK